MKSKSVRWARPTGQELDKSVIKKVRVEIEMAGQSSELRKR